MSIFGIFANCEDININDFVLVDTTLSEDRAKEMIALNHDRYIDEYFSNCKDSYKDFAEQVDLCILEFGPSYEYPAS